CSTICLKIWGSDQRTLTLSVSMSTFGAPTQTGTNLFGSTSTQNNPGGAGGGLFGNAQQNATQPATTGTSLFGNPAPAATNPFGSTTTGSGTTGGGLFGNTTTNPSGGGLFGNTGTQPAAGGLFGGTANTQQPQSAAGGGGLFGNTNTQPSGGALFGNTGTQQQQPAGGSLFAGTSTATTQPSGGGLFGSTNAQQPAGGSLFGGASAQQLATGSSFGGATNQQPAGGGLFGSTTAQQQPAAGTGLFGNTTGQQPAGGSLFGSTTTQQQSTTGLFGGTTGTQAPTTGGLFGSTAGSNPLFGNKSPASIFGTQAVPTNTTTTTTPSLFGQSTQTPQPATSLFGQAQAKPAGSLFGSTAQPSTTGGLFGSTIAPPVVTSSSLLGLRPSQTSSIQQQSDPQSQFAALTQRIDAIAEAWNANSPQCRFQHYFYNLVDPSQVSLYGRPSNATNEALWQRAVRENPDPTCLVPVLALGFDALQTRVEAQTQQAAAQQEKLKASIRPEEEALRVALEEMEEEIRRPGGTSRMRAKLNGLWALVGAVNAARERGRKAGVDGATEWTVVDEDGLKQIAQILVDQQAGLEHLTKILQRDLKDLRVITGDGTEEEDLSSEKLYSSTSTLHASTLR
ncbi:hypothetical protein ID866_8196, partial [Astraeus odoratus]